MGLVVAVGALGVHAGAAEGAACVPLFHPVRASALPLTDPTSLAAGDFAGDARVDLAFSRTTSFGQPGTTGMGILPARAPGVFGRPAAALVDLPGFTGAIAGELTGDHYLDLATVGEGTGLVVLAANGKGGFTRLRGPALGAGARVGAVTRVNRDGNLDVIAVESAGDAGSYLRVLLGDGAGGFAAQPPSLVATDGATVAAGDVNRDHGTDLVVGALAGNFPAVQVLLGDGAGGFTPVPSPVTWRDGPTTGDVYQLALADFDLDGRLDLVTRRTYNAPQLRLAVGDGTGRFGEHGPGWTVRTNTYPDSLAVGRFDSDHVPDVALGSWTYDETGRRSTWITVLQGDGRGGWREAPGSPYDKDVGIAHLTAADLNHDKFDELVGVDVPTANSGTLHVLLNSAGQAFTGDRVPIRVDSPVIRSPLPRADGDLPGDTGEFFPDVIYGERVAFTAFFTCEPAALPHRTFALYRRLATTATRFGGWKRIALRTTDGQGRARAADRPPRNAQYQWRPADRRRPPLRRGPVQRLTVGPHITVAPTQNGTVSGRVNPPRRGAKITFYASDGGGGDEERWTRAGTATVRRSGAFRHGALRGGVGYIAVLPANDRYAIGVSPRFR